MTPEERDAAEDFYADPENHVEECDCPACEERWYEEEARRRAYARTNPGSYEYNQYEANS